MWSWIYRVIMIAGPAAIGYFTNDLGDAAARVTGIAVDERGRLRWYWIVLLLVIVAGLFIWFVSLLVPKKYQK